MNRPAEDDESARQVATLQSVMTPLLAATAIYAVAALLLLPDGAQSTLIALSMGGILGLLTLLARRGRPKLAGALIVLLLWAFATFDLIIGGGLAAPGQGVYVLAILLAAFIVGVRMAIVTTILSIAATGGVLWLETTGRLPESRIVRDPQTYWWALITIFTAASGLVWLALRRIGEAIDDARRSERLYRLVTETAGEFIWQMRPDGSFTYASPAVEKILGFSQAEMLGRRAIQDQLAPGSPDIASLIGEAVAQGRDQVHYQAQQLRKDGEYVWCEFTVRLLLDDAGQLVGLTGVTRDISERKREEEKREQLEVQLRQSQKMEAVGQLAGGIAHDFNNYLTVILGNAEMMALDTQAEKGSPLLEIEDAAIRSSELTRQLLAFSRKQVQQPVVLDLNRVVRETDRLLRRVLGEDIEIETICAGGLGNVEVDPAQLDQILLNLAVNARAAMPNGGKLTIETGNVYLDAEYAARRTEVEPGRYVMLAVSDNGVGMDEATIGRIFEPFFTTRETGNGLGLSTVHGIVKQSGGSIGVYSEPGEGTTFRIYLPRVEARVGSEPSRLELSSETRGRGTETVLVVEDQEMVRRLVRNMLEGHGYRVFTASDRDQAIAIAEVEGERIDLLLTDIVLPGPSGVEIARELTDRLGLEIPVLYMTGFTENGIVHRGILDPGQRLLQKPFTTDQLLQKLRDALDD